MRLTVRLWFLFMVCGMAFAQFPTQIKNVVVIVQENRTPDNLFHFLTPACHIPTGATGYQACSPSVTSSCYDVSPCGLSNQSGTVVPITLTAMPLAGSADLIHSHLAFDKCATPTRTSSAATTGPGKRLRTGLPMDTSKTLR
jgi:hypothetical protein